MELFKRTASIRNRDSKHSGQSGVVAVQNCTDPISPLFVADWPQLVFHHFRVDEQLLNHFVPFELDRFEGRVYVSLVGLKTTRIYVNRIGEWACWLHRPLTHHSFFNVRTYVRHRGETGVYFLKIFVDSRPAVPMARLGYGLPYHYAKLSLEHSFSKSEITGHIETNSGKVKYTAEHFPNIESQQCSPGSEVEFLSERYTAFTRRNYFRRMFRIWHPPWTLFELETKWMDQSLLFAEFPWFQGAQHRCSFWTSGTFDVGIGRPSWIR